MCATENCARDSHSKSAPLRLWPVLHHGRQCVSFASTPIMRQRSTSLSTRFTFLRPVQQASFTQTSGLVAPGSLLEQLRRLSGPRVLQGQKFFRRAFRPDRHRPRQTTTEPAFAVMRRPPATKTKSVR